MRLDGNQVVFVLRVEHKQDSNTRNAVVQGEMLGGLEPLNTHTKIYPLDTSHQDLQQNNWHFHLHDLRSGTKFSFASWQELQDYIKEQTKKGLH